MYKAYRNPQLADSTRSKPPVRFLARAQAGEFTQRGTLVETGSKELRARATRGISVT